MCDGYLLSVSVWLVDVYAGWSRRLSCSGSEQAREWHFVGFEEFPSLCICEG